ncbi:MAG: hypothetical protein A2655_04565 [Candidatus Yanofskybacteria bacterium RIFCSPHIGHO2_01_FULL_43_42]|uniref:SCP domain-containing protein n=1 Tax=Candidatus Taylorbacteria bacterium RIFCSPLOWO2_01_FULL_45_15b TaxID=1802319 RepID=A0A1G2N8Z6_9BACT|nr:MAG: hypothetical protein A2655_04565 [Candidatus Yanofskybacteria bacterium RIFCSPHIGHO2_01_FULL_43_42]OHA32604.1 MAG: hypothetical protein A2928_02750 [Candidatus Taylorbacteria bacterium RIFCSPLOWO2_01_FULL_45_15b]
MGVFPKQRLILFLLVATIAAGFFLYKERAIFLSVEQKLESAYHKVVDEAVFNPEPLLRLFKETGAPLDSRLVINFTNTERTTRNLNALSANTLLDSAALKKAEDILERDYFEHTAPDGIKASDLVSDAGYQFLLVGENLALGNFDDEADLVAAWMDSPGHRANILQPKYKDIGVAAVRGEYEGKDVWVSVQIFAVPSSECEAPSPRQATVIEEMRIAVKLLRDEIEEKKNELDENKKNPERYNKIVDEYNSLVGEYEELTEDLKNSITTYNSAVRSYNGCIEALQ